MISLRLATRLSIAAGGAGVAGDLLLRAAPWGVNFALWIVCCVGAAVSVDLTVRRARARSGLYRLSPALAFAACLAWRDAPQLAALNVLGTGLALLVPTLAGSVPSLRTAGLSTYLIEPARTALNAALGPLAAAADGIEPRGLEPASRTRRFARVAVGVAIAVPVGLVFGRLLTAADPVFGHFLNRLLDWNFRGLVSHLGVAGGLAWVGSGYLLRYAGQGIRRGPSVAALPAPRFGVAELGPALGLLAALFAAFVLVQARYLFGGASLVERTLGLSYADYARQGFGQLVAVALLVVPTLLASEWLLDRRTPGARAVRILELVLMAFTLVIVGSAFERMRLYVANYGLSVERIYASSVMVWVVLTLAWLAFTTLRGRAERFAFGAMIAGFGVLAGLNGLNPERLTVRLNLARADAGRELDAAYLLRLSDDALPSAVDGLVRRGVVVSCAAIDRVRAGLHARSARDWRSWNLARAKARSALENIDESWASRCVADD